MRTWADLFPILDFGFRVHQMRLSVQLTLKVSDPGNLIPVFCHPEIGIKRAQSLRFTLGIRILSHSSPFLDAWRHA